MLDYEIIYALKERFKEYEMGKLFLQSVMFAMWAFFAWFMYTQAHYSAFESLGFGFLGMFVMWCILGIMWAARTGNWTYQVGGSGDRYSGADGESNFRRDEIAAIKANRMPTQWEYSNMIDTSRPMVGTWTRQDK